MVKVSSSSWSLTNQTLRWLRWLILNWLTWTVFFDNLVILIKWCKIPHKNVDKVLSFLSNQVFCLKNWAPNTIEFNKLCWNKFCWNFVHISYLPMCSKGSLRFVSFCLDIELFAKIKAWFPHTQRNQFYQTK